MPHIVCRLLLETKTDQTDDRSSASLGHQRLTGHLGLDELSDQLRIAVVESVRTGDGDSIDVRQPSKARSVGNPYKWITQPDDHQRGNDEVVQAFQRRVASHRPEQRQASQSPEPEVVPRRDREHRWWLA